MMTTVETTLTVEQIAEAFAGLGSNQQAAFFAHVHREFEKRGWWAEQQWHYMCGHIDGDEWLTEIGTDLRKDAREALMSMAAPLYLHTLRAIDGARA
jgi:hypothetical protein